MSREDYRTNTVEDAAYFEYHRGMNDDYDDDRPTRAEAEADDYWEARDGGRRRAVPSLAETARAALRLSEDHPAITETRHGVIAITSTYTDERVATILRPLGIEVARGTDGHLYARDSLTSADPWGPATDPGPPPF